MKRLSLTLLTALVAALVFGPVACSSDDHRHHNDRDDYRDRDRDGPPHGAPHGPGSDPNERR